MGHTTPRETSPLAQHDGLISHIELAPLIG